MRTRISALALLVVLGAGGVAGAAEAEGAPPWFTVMGDSWGFLMLDAFKDELAERGLGDVPVLQISVPGTTAEQWATNAFGLLDVARLVAELSPGRPIFYVSLGGNDLLQRYPVDGDAVFAEIEADLGTIVDEVAAVRSDALLLFAGYDLLKLDKSLFCLAFSELVFGSSEPAEVNPVFVEIGAAQRAVADARSEALYSDLWGTLQGSPGEPDLSSWSPGRYFPDDDLDCVHLNDLGYEVFVDALFDELIAPGP